MTPSKRPMVDVAEVLSVLVTLGAGNALVLVRGVVDNSVIVLVLAAVVSLCGALGGWRAGVWAAVSAAVAFNFFHTRPYLSLRIHDADDIYTTAALVVVGVIAGVTSSVSRRRSGRAVEAGNELAAVERVADLVATGSDADDVETAVRAELLDVLQLSGCRFQRSPEGRTVLGRHGEHSETVRTYHDGGFELPPNGVAIPVLRRGEPIGHLVCDPIPGVAVSAVRRRAAVTLADLLGAAHPADPSDSRT